MTRAFTAIAAHLQARSGLALTPDKMYLLESRLAPILRTERLAGLDDLAFRLPLNEGLSKAVVEAMTTNESLFFRDGAPFRHVKEVALPRLHRILPPGQPLRIWSAAASTGQEAYSLAILVAELRDQLEGRPVEILGTDIAAGPLNQARAGLYTQWEVQRGLTGAHLARWFRREGERWRIDPALRAAVRFREWNLLDPLAPLGRFDIVFCRNVLIYFDPPTKVRALHAITDQLSAGGVLYLGASETPLGLVANLTRETADCAAYRAA